MSSELTSHIQVYGSAGQFRIDGSQTVMAMFEQAIDTAKDLISDIPVAAQAQIGFRPEQVTM